MASTGILLASLLLLSCLAETSHGVLLSSLKQTLIVTASHKEGQGIYKHFLLKFSNFLVQNLDFETGFPLLFIVIPAKSPTFLFKILTFQLGFFNFSFSLPD